MCNNCNALKACHRRKSARLCGPCCRKFDYEFHRRSTIAIVELIEIGWIFQPQNSSKLLDEPYVQQWARTQKEVIVIDDKSTTGAPRLIKVHDIRPPFLKFYVWTDSLRNIIKTKNRQREII